MARNREAFDRVELRPTAFGQVAEPDTSTTILGRPAAAPIVLAPTGYTRLSHHTGRARGRRRGGRGRPALHAVDLRHDLDPRRRAARRPAGRNWFQLYLMKDRDGEPRAPRRGARARATRRWC